MGRVQIIDLEHRNLKHFLGWMTPLCGSEWSVCSDIPYFSGTEEVEGGEGGGCFQQASLLTHYLCKQQMYKQGMDDTGEGVVS